MYDCDWTEQKEEEFVFSDISERPVPSLLRGYSSPIRLESDLTDSDLSFLLAHDSDEFNRFVFLNAVIPLFFFFVISNCWTEIYLIIFLFSWEAGQLLARKLMLSLVADFQQNKPLVLNPNFVHGLRSILGDSSLDKV